VTANLAQSATCCSPSIKTTPGCASLRSTSIKAEQGAVVGSRRCNAILGLNRNTLRKKLSELGTRKKSKAREDRALDEA
jgi:hypothetical protein